MAIDRKYGRVSFDKSNTIGENEPVVVFRAQDAFLLNVLGYYWRLCRNNESPANHMSALQETMDEIEEWQSKNQTQVPRSDSHG